MAAGLNPCMQLARSCTVPKTNIDPEKLWLGDYFPFGARPIFRGELLVLGRVFHVEPWIRHLQKWIFIASPKICKILIRENDNFIQFIIVVIFPWYIVPLPQRRLRVPFKDISNDIVGNAMSQCWDSGLEPQEATKKERPVYLWLN